LETNTPESCEMQAPKQSDNLVDNLNAESCKNNVVHEVFIEDVDQNSATESEPQSESQNDDKAISNLIEKATAISKSKCMFCFRSIF
jgi:hypothetical protein